jgi:hypothetical protein
LYVNTHGFAKAKPCATKTLQWSIRLLFFGAFFIEKRFSIINNTLITNIIIHTATLEFNPEHGTDIFEQKITEVQGVFILLWGLVVRQAKSERGYTNGDRVQLVVQALLFREDEEPRDHSCDSCLIRATMTGNRTLYLLGRAFDDGQSDETGAGKDRTARFRDPDRRFLIDAEKERLNGECIGCVSPYSVRNGT